MSEDERASDGPGDLSARFRAHVRSEQLIPRGGRIVVGVSGRRDSVALLYLLHEAAAALELRLAIAHIQHGEDQNRRADADFVLDLAKALRTPLDVFVDKTRERDPRSRTSLRARHFAQVLSRIGADAVATGETLDDAAEELLDTLVTGAATLSARRDAAGPFVHPLLPFSRQECRMFLAARGATYRRDPEILRAETTQDKLRLLILPLLRRHVEREASKNLAATARLLADDDTFLTDLAMAARGETGWRAASGAVSFDYQRWAALPAALRRRLLAEAAWAIFPNLRLSRAALGELERGCLQLSESAQATTGVLKASRARGTLSLTRHDHVTPPPAAS